MLDEADCRRIFMDSAPDDWRRPPGRPRITWFKTTGMWQDLKLKNLSLNETINMAPKRPLCRDCCVHLALHTPSGVCQKRRGKSALIVVVIVVLGGVAGWRCGWVVRTSVFGWQTFPDLCLIYGWHVTTSKVVSTVGHPTRPTQPFIPVVVYQ